LHYLEFPKFNGKKKSKRRLFRQLSKFFLFYFKFVKSFSKFFKFNILNFRYQFFRIKSFIFHFNNIVQNLNVCKLKDIRKFSFLNFDFSAGFFFLGINNSSKLMQGVVKNKVQSYSVVKQNLFSVNIVSKKLKNSGNNFRYFWLLLSSGSSTDFYKSFSIFLNSYVSIASRFLNCFIPFKKFSSVLWFLSFLNKSNYSNILTVLNNYNQFLYFVSISNNKKEFSYLFKNLPLFLHYPVLQEISYVSVNLTSNLAKVFDSIFFYYRMSYNKNFNNKFEQIFVSSEIKIPLMFLKKIRKTFVQKNIIEKQNLANIENLKIQAKRLLQRKRIVIFSKINETIVKKKKRIRKKKTIAQLLFKKFLKSIQARNIKKKTKKIFLKHLSKRLSFAFKRGSYVNRQGGRRPKRNKIEVRRKVKRFFSNVMFVVKFIKEKKILKSYYKFNKRSFRLSRFHKLSSPFFLRLKLKRLYLLNNKKRLLYRTSFLAGSSVSLSLAMSTSVFFTFTFFNAKNYQNFAEYSDKFYASYYLICKNYSFSSIDLLLLKNWLILIKNNYYMYTLKSFFSFLPVVIKEYLELLKFFFKGGFFFH